MAVIQYMLAHARVCALAGWHTAGLMAIQYMHTNAHVCAQRRYTAGMMVIQYMLANAGVARAFSGYLGNLCGQSTDFFIIGTSIDLWAGGIILLMTALLCFGTQESAWFNNGVCVCVCVRARVCVCPCYRERAHGSTTARVCVCVHVCVCVEGYKVCDCTVRVCACMRVLHQC